MKNKQIEEIKELGQTIWLDHSNSEIISSGHLQKYIDDGISGVAANHIIFSNLLVGSAVNNERIKELSKQQKNNEEIFLSLAVDYIKIAADQLIPVYERSSGMDGFVNIEITPRLAHDADATIQQARTLWKILDRRNIMIKIPATIEGVTAIRKCISEGMNINCTLLFGLPRYKEVIDAYIAGLEDRIKAKKTIDKVVSIASFNIDRIDALTESLLEARGMADLMGQLGISSAKKALEMYRTVFGSELFMNLEAKGAKPQRLLWKRTNEEAPSFANVKYAEVLLGKETINAITPEVLGALNGHGFIATDLDDDLEHANAVLAELKEKGIDINMITRKLEYDTVKTLNKWHNEKLGEIERARS